MEITPALIRRFFANDCNAAEAAAVADYLEQHPELLEQWLPEEEWETFETTERLPAAHSMAMLDAVKQQSTVAPVKRMLPKIIIAAAAMLAGLLVWVYRPSGKESPAPAHTPASPTAIAAASEMIRVNKDREKISIPLEDGSVVELGSNSQLKWHAGQRKVYLEGKAQFTVTANAANPFIVYTKQVTTTVLGTVFEINAGTTTHIKLLSGKVSIQPATDTSMARAIYLEPGQAADFRIATQTFEVHRSKAADLTPTPAPIMGTVEETNDAFVYTKVPLPQLLAGLAQQYNIHINYSPARLKKYYFSGQLLKTESAATILNTIGLLNKLNVTQDSTGFHIYK